MDDAFGNWLAGFMDGEGCFYIGRHRRGGYTGFSPGAKIVLRIDDLPILEEISRETGVGTVRALGHTRPQSNQRPQAAWHVGSKPDCLRLVALFEEFPLRAKKSRDFAIWSEAVRYWASRNWYPGGNRGPQDWSKMDEYDRALAEVRAFTEVDRCPKPTSLSVSRISNRSDRLFAV